MRTTVAAVINFDISYLRNQSIFKIGKKTMRRYVYPNINSDLSSFQLNRLIVVIMNNIQTNEILVLSKNMKQMLNKKVASHLRIYRPHPPSEVAILT